MYSHFPHICKKRNKKNKKNVFYALPHKVDIKLKHLLYTISQSLIDFKCNVNIQLGLNGF